MSNSAVLDGFINYGKREYSAQNYGFIMWGHGSGWRSSPQQGAQNRAIAFDDSASDYMTTAEFAQVLKNKDITCIGFDTCFGSELEVLYELKECAHWFAASASVTPSGGWEYTQLFNLFLQTDLSGSQFADCALSQFAAQYAGYPNVHISKIDLTTVNTLALSFDSFAKELAQSITDTNTQEKIRQLLLNGVNAYKNTSYPSEYYLDIQDLAEKSAALFPALKNSADQLQASLNQTVVNIWSSNGMSSNGGIGVFLISFSALGMPSQSHDISYQYGSQMPNQNAFVKDFQYWAPHYSTKDVSVLDKVFYQTF